MFKNFINAFKVKEIRNKILLTILLVLIYRLGCWIPVPGVDASAFANQVSGDEGFLGLLSSVSGGALANGSLLALGIAPYISASIIIQLLTIAIPSLERLSKMGDEGRKKIAGYTKIAALVLAIAQAVAIVISFEGVLKESTLGAGFILPTWVVGIVVTLVLIAGSMFTYWLGEKITEIGISNGQSILIFVGILSTAGTSLLTNFTNIFNGDMGSLTELLLFILALILIFGFINVGLAVYNRNRLLGHVFIQWCAIHPRQACVTSTPATGHSSHATGITSIILGLDLSPPIAIFNLSFITARSL